MTHRYGNRHFVSSHCVHWARHEGSLQYYIPRDTRFSDNIACGEINMSREQEEVVISQSAVDARLHEFVDRESIESLVCFQKFHSIFRIQ